MPSQLHLLIQLAPPLKVAHTVKESSLLSQNPWSAVDAPCTDTKQSAHLVPHHAQFLRPLIQLSV